MYLFYIDESGNRDVGHIEQERFYVLTAVGMFGNVFTSTSHAPNAVSFLALKHNRALLLISRWMWR